VVLFQELIKYLKSAWCLNYGGALITVSTVLQNFMEMDLQIVIRFILYCVT